MSETPVKRPVGRPRLNKPRPALGPRGAPPTWRGDAPVVLAGLATATKLQRDSRRRDIVFHMADLEGGSATLDALSARFGRAQVLALIRNGWLAFVDGEAARVPPREVAQ